MCNRAILLSFFSAALITALLGAGPAWSQSASHGFSPNQQPSQQQIRQFCKNYPQLSGSQRKQYRAEYERYCKPTFGQPTAPQTGQQPQQRQQPQPEPEPEPDEPEAEPEPEPEIKPAEPEPVIPEPEPSRVDLAGTLRLEGPLARKAGERQRLRVIVRNRGADPAPGGRLWARVFLSERDAARSGVSSSFSLPVVQHGRQVRIPGVPGPGREREARVQVTVPSTVEPGSYWWCVQVDSRQAIEETDEDNNVACAKKVVAVGGKPQKHDSELSTVFGSRVDELTERTDVPEKTRFDIGKPETRGEDLLSHLRGSPCGEATRIRVTSPAESNDNQDRAIAIYDDAGTAYARCGIGVDMDIIIEARSLEPGVYHVFGNASTWPYTGALDHTIRVETQCGSATFTVPTDRNECKHLMATVTLPEGLIEAEDGRMVGGPKCKSPDLPIFNCLEGAL